MKTWTSLRKFLTALGFALSMAGVVYSYANYTSSTHAIKSVPLMASQDLDLRKKFEESLDRREGHAVARMLFETERNTASVLHSLLTNVLIEAKFRALVEAFLMVCVGGIFSVLLLSDRKDGRG